MSAVLARHRATRSDDEKVTGTDACALGREREERGPIYCRWARMRRETLLGRAKSGVFLPQYCRSDSMLRGMDGHLDFIRGARGCDPGHDRRRRRGVGTMS